MGGDPGETLAPLALHADQRAEAERCEEVEDDVEVHAVVLRAGLAPAPVGGRVPRYG